METAYDFLTVAVFCAIAFVYLQRSVQPPPRGDRTIDYVLCAVGCAGANWLGNEGHHAPAIALLIAACAYFVIRLHPFRPS